MRTISLKVEEGLDRKLVTIARKRGMSKSRLVRQALEVYFAADATASPGSCLELAADVVGCAEGPPDLATNKKYLKGFGK